MNIAFYNFTKRRNSTKLPTGTGTIKDCKLKDNCSVHNPVILLSNSPVLYDYAYIQAWSRYYFVEDIISVANGLTEYHLVEDVLASNKTAIGTTKALIAYSSSAYDTYIPDPRLTLRSSKTAQGAVDSSASDLFEAPGNYIVSVYTSLADASSGFTTTYLMRNAGLNLLRNWFANSSLITALEDYFGGMPFNSICSCKWIPYKPYVTDAPQVANICIGNEFLTVPAGVEIRRITGFPTINETYNITRPRIYNDFRQYEPYTTGCVYLPGVGNLEVNLSQFGNSKINISCTVEVITGNVDYFLFRDDGAMMQKASCNVAADCPIGGVTTSGGSVMSSLGATIGGVATLFAGVLTGGAALAAGGAAAAAAGVASTILNTNKIGTSVTGSFGGRGVVLWPTPTFIEYAVDTIDPLDTSWVAEKGRPVGEVHQINTHSGYIQTIDAHIALNATAEEMEEVDNFLNSGIYFE